MQTDQCELRDKIKGHAQQVDVQIAELNEKFAGIYQAIEGQARQLQTLHDTVSQFSNTVTLFTNQQLAAANAQTAATAALTAQQTKMFEMLDALQNRAITSEPSEKKAKAADKASSES